MGLKVLGAGLPRTGTGSLKVALEILLNSPCYHMSELRRHPEHTKFWHAAAEARPINWEELFHGYSAAVDAPTCFFWPELIQAFPQALVVLSVRDADAWFESCIQTIFKERRHPRDNEPSPRGPAGTATNAPDASGEHRRPLLAHPAMQARLPFPHGAPREATIRKYEEHNAAVRAGIPPERLLVWKPEDGWEPLCAALHLPVPDIPFPHMNTQRTFRFRRFLASLLGRRLADRTVRFMEAQRQRLRQAR
jgi:hypothetical protein